MKTINLYRVLFALACFVPAVSAWADSYTVTDLGALGDSFSLGNALNSGGEAVGSSVNGDGQEHAFAYVGDTMTDLGTLGGTYSTAHAN